MKTAFMALCLAATAIVAAQIDGAKAVIVVNGEEIRGNEYYRRMEFLPGVGRMANNQFVEAPPGILTILRLIDERLLIQLAKDKGVYPSDAEVQAEIKQRTDDNPKLQEGLALLGLTREDFAYQVRLDLVDFKLRTQGITITDQEVEKFFNDNPSTFTIPKRYKLRVVAVGDLAGRTAVDADLKAGMKFEDVAKKHSVEVSRTLGGDIGLQAEDQLSGPVKAAVTAVKIGQYTDWVTGGQASIRFYVENILPAEKRQLNPALRQEIRRKLMIDKGAVRNNIDKDLRELRRKAVVETKVPQFTDAVKKYMDSARMGG
ncbi:MAG: peptidyl-prolyl cis-trans isomerase [Fimbriimonadaceae bacterium]|nr:peptidyl-prolyl cis-trans isomerase [Fimbriimonadaceae bacterium]